MNFTTAATILLAASTTAAAASTTQTTPPRRQLRNNPMPYLTPSDLQSIVPNYDPDIEADKWISLSQDMEFLPLAGNSDNRKLQKAARDLQDAYYNDYSGANHTHGAYDISNPYSVQPFIEGMSGYDEYQQAWRLLGFVVDCNEIIYDDDYVESEGHSNDNAGTLTEDGCARYVMWAAYVDTEYEGGGIGEYQYYDRENGRWDDSACYVDKDGKYNAGNDDGDENRELQENNGEGEQGENQYGDGNSKSRCAKMDCHLEDTHFSVLGFFKHRSHEQWMEQLFKHEGVCVWTEDEYAFMKDARKVWPKGCTETGQTTKKGVPLYYDIKPLRNGRISLGLYTDTQCLEEYSANTKTVESILGNIFANYNDEQDGGNDFSGDSLSDSMDRWNSAFDVWTYCHPCRVHDLENTDGSKYAEFFGYDDEYYRDDDQQEHHLESKPKGDVFECYDDAGYTNVNQCMKFSAKTVMKTATFRDLSLGRHQGTLVQTPLSGYVVRNGTFHKHRLSTAGTYLFFVGSAGLLAFSAYNLYKVKKRNKVGDGANRESLL